MCVSAGCGRYSVTMPAHRRLSKQCMARGMLSAFRSRHTEASKMRLSLWPQSLYGRLIAASIVALLLAQVVSVVMIARERERFILQGSVWEWSRRIAEVTTMLQTVDDRERSAMVARLAARPLRFPRRPPEVLVFRDRPGSPDTAELGPPPPEAHSLSPAEARGLPPGEARGLMRRANTYQVMVPFTKVGDFEQTFEQQ